MMLQPLLGSAELLSYIHTNETILSLVSSSCLLRNTPPMDFTSLLPGDIVVSDSVMRRNTSTGEITFELKRLYLLARKPHHPVLYS